MQQIQTDGYKYNANALDSEIEFTRFAKTSKTIKKMRQTGNYYYGARYYNPKLSIWLSVDPLAEKYPSHSPYNYTLNNPVKYIDPDGRSVDEPKDWIPKVSDDGTIKYIKEENDTAETLDAQFSNINADQAKTLFSNLQQESKIDGTCDWFISGDDVADVLGTQILKLRNTRTNSQDTFNQFMFSYDVTKAYYSKDKYFDTWDFFNSNNLSVARGYAALNDNKGVFNVYFNFRITDYGKFLGQPRGVGVALNPEIMNTPDGGTFRNEADSFHFRMYDTRKGNQYGSNFYHSILINRSNTGRFIKRLKRIEIIKPKLPVLKN